MDSKIFALIATIALISSSMMALDSNTPDDKFQSFKLKHGKAYETDEEHAYRLAVYTENTMEIDDHNNQGGITYTRGENKFTDLTKEEFQAQYLTKITLIQDRDDEISEEYTSGSVNWVERGAVQKVKNQGYCGSCWAFSSAAVVESAKFIQTGTLGDFSEQQLVSCDTNNGGCNGGFQGWALDHYASNGICTESSYPYTSGDGSVASCQENYCKKDSFRINGYSWVGRDVSSLKSAASKQPVSVCVDASNWSSYSSGIFDSCGTGINHAVVLAGYQGNDYWLIKNSWDTQWGEEGYIRLAGGDNTCGILSQSVIPK